MRTAELEWDLLPAQPSRYQSECAERNLWARVFSLAIDDLRHGGRHTPATVSWINDASAYVGSFEWVCATLGVDGATVRAKVRELSTQL